MGDRGKFGPASEQNWSDTASEDHPESPIWSTTQSEASTWISEVPTEEKHEYHEISDEEDSPSVAPVKKEVS